MKIDLDHQSAKSANRSDKKKQTWEVVAQHWKVQAETKGRYAPSFCDFLEYAARCYVPVSYAHVEWKEKSRVLLAVAVPVTYRQLAAATGTSGATSSKIIGDMRTIGCRYEDQLLLMPAVNHDLYEILDDELPRKNRDGGKGFGALFGAGKKPKQPEGGDAEPVVLGKLNRGSKAADKPSEETSDGGLLDEEEVETQVEGDRIARCREVGEGRVLVFY